jgi:hypothetical protein
MEEDPESKNILRSIFMNYHLVEILDSNDNYKSIKSVEIKSMRNVIIKIESKEGCEDIKIDESESKSRSFKNILKLLHNKILPEVFLLTNIKNYKISISEFPEGKTLFELEKLTISEFFSFFEQFLDFLNFLSSSKIKISEIKLEDLIINSNGILKLKNMKYAYFDENYDEYSLFPLVKSAYDFLKLKIKENKTWRFKNLEIFFELQKNGKISEIFNICKDSGQNCNAPHAFVANSFKIILVDFLVIDEIIKAGFKITNYNLINDQSKKEYYIYRLVEQNLLVRKDEQDNDIYKTNREFKTEIQHDIQSNISSNSILNNAHSNIQNNSHSNMQGSGLQTNIQSSFMNSMPNYENQKESILPTESNLINDRNATCDNEQCLNRKIDTFDLNKRKEKQGEVIQRRSELLEKYIKVSSPFCSFFDCCKDYNFSFLEIPLLMPDKIHKILKIFRFLRIISWRNGDTILIEDEKNNLNIIAIIKNGKKLIFYKEKGITCDFLKLISQIIELMKYFKK